MEIKLSSDEDDEHDDSQKGGSLSYATTAVAVFLLSWQARFRVPGDCIGALLGFLHHFLAFLYVLLITFNFCKNHSQKCLAASSFCRC